VQDLKIKFNIASIDEELDGTTVSYCNFDHEYLEGLTNVDL